MRGQFKSVSSLGDMKTKTGQFSRRSSTEVAKFNMAAFDLERMDDALRNAHNKLREAKDTPTLNNLDGAFEDIRHALVILKWAYGRDFRKSLVKLEGQLQMDLTQLRQVNNGEITYSEADAIMTALWKLLDGIYEAKQMSGMGIPKNKFSGAEARIKKAVEA